MELVMLSVSGFAIIAVYCAFSEITGAIRSRTELMAEEMRRARDDRFQDMRAESLRYATQLFQGRMVSPADAMAVAVDYFLPYIKENRVDFDSRWQRVVDSPDVDYGRPFPIDESVLTTGEA